MFHCFAVLLFLGGGMEEARRGGRKGGSGGTKGGKKFDYGDLTVAYLCGAFFYRNAWSVSGKRLHDKSAKAKGSPLLVANSSSQLSAICNGCPAREHLVHILARILFWFCFVFVIILLIILLVHLVLLSFFFALQV